MRTGVTVELSASDRQHLCGDREVSEQSTEASLAGTDRPAHGRRLRHSGDHAPDRHQRDSGLALADMPFVSADRYRPRRQPERRSGYARTPAGATPAKRPSRNSNRGGLKLGGSRESEASPIVGASDVDPRDPGRA
jgi:hypothetical protein